MRLVPTMGCAKNARTRVLLGLGLFLLVPVELAGDAGGDPACRAAEALIAGLEETSPAVAVAVVRSGEILCEWIGGRPDPAAAVEADRHTRFYLASLAKPLTAAAVLRLVEQGELDLSDSVRDHLPELPEAYAEVALRSLLKHQSGTPDHFDHLPPESLAGLTNEGVLDFLRARGELEFSPGSQWSYSNSGYVLLAEVVARVTGSSYATWMHDRLFEEIGMSDASVGDRGLGVALGYQRNEVGEQRPAPVSIRTQGPGGIYASLTDLETWFLALRRGEVLSPPLLLQAVAPTKTAVGTLTPFTLMFQVEDVEKGLYYAGAFGLLGGFDHAFVWLPDRDAAYIFLAARSDLEPTALIEPLKSARSE